MWAGNARLRSENPDTKVVIKDSWVDAIPKEADTLSEIWDGRSDDEKAMFLTILIHEVVTIDGREDFKQEFLLNGYWLAPTIPRMIQLIRWKYSTVRSMHSKR